MRIAGQSADPEVAFEVTQDSPHENLSFGYPFEIGRDNAGKRIAVAKEELTLADLDVRDRVADACAATCGRRSTACWPPTIGSAARRRDRGPRRARPTGRPGAFRGRRGAQARRDRRPSLASPERGPTPISRRSARVSAAGRPECRAQPAPGRAVAIAGKLTEAPPAPAFDGAMALARNVEPRPAHRGAGAGHRSRRVDLLRTERVPTPALSSGLPMNAPGEFTPARPASPSRFRSSPGTRARSPSRWRTSTQIRARHDAARRTVESQVFGAIARIGAQRRQRRVPTAAGFVPTTAVLVSLAEESYELGRTLRPGLLRSPAQPFETSAANTCRRCSISRRPFADLEEIIGAPIA